MGALAKCARAGFECGTLLDLTTIGVSALLRLPSLARKKATTSVVRNSNGNRRPFIAV